MRQRTLWIGAALLLGTTLLSGCGTKAADAAAAVRAIASLNAAGDTVRVITTVSFPGVADGRGPITAYHLRVERSTPGPVMSITKLNVPITKLTDTTYVPTGTTLAVGQNATGKACAASVRRALTSQEKCTSWAVTFSDVAPPPPDTVIVQPGTTVIGFQVKPDEATLYVNASTTFCAFYMLDDGKWYGAPYTDGTSAADYSSCASGYSSWFPITERTPTLVRAVAMVGALPVERGRLAAREGFMWSRTG